MMNKCVKGIYLNWFGMSKKTRAHEARDLPKPIKIGGIVGEAVAIKDRYFAELFIPDGYYTNLTGVAEAYLKRRLLP